MIRAELAIGKPSKGFTLIEVLFSVTILVSGIFFIYPAFFRSSGVLTRIASRYETSRLAQDLIEETGSRLRKQKNLGVSRESGRRVIAGHEYPYTLCVSPMDLKNCSYRVDVSIRLKTGEFSRTAVVLR